MQHVGFVILIIVLVVIVAYAFIINKPSTGSFKNFFSYSTTSTKPAPAAGGGYSSGTRYVAPAPSPTSYNGTAVQQQINPQDIPVGFTLKDLSPYFKKVNISVSPGYFGSYSQIAFSLNLNAGNRADITGWSIKGNRGNIYIPQAVDVYDSSGLASPSDIYLGSGEVVNIYSNNSAIGQNLRMNKCIGYLSNSNPFSPPLPNSCPYVNRSDIANFTGQCQSYIMSLGSCQVPAANPPIPINDYSCQNYLSKLNYGGCFAAHRSDYDFLSNEWRVWTGTQFLDSQHDRLLVFDRQGLLATEYSY